MFTNGLGICGTSGFGIERRKGFLFVKTSVRILVLVSLYFAFVFAAFWLRSKIRCLAEAEVWGWDYQTFVGQIQDWRWIAYFGFRHPGLGIVYSPLVALEHLWNGMYLLVMPLVAMMTAWLILKMSGWVGFVVWLVMPTTWILAGVPESFPVAQLALVGSCHWLLNGKCVAARWGQRALPLVSVVFTVLNTMITLTNGVKPLLGYLVAYGREMDRKVLVRGSLAVAGLVALGVGFFICGH